MASLQKPKKISLKGSDGKCYTMMCKPKDDLRKDCRLMEFNCLVNKVIFTLKNKNKAVSVSKTHSYAWSPGQGHRAPCRTSC